MADDEYISLEGCVERFVENFAKHNPYSATSSDSQWLQGDSGLKLVAKTLGVKREVLAEAIIMHRQARTERCPIVPKTGGAKWIG